MRSSAPLARAVPVPPMPDASARLGGATRGWEGKPRYTPPVCGIASPIAQSLGRERKPTKPPVAEGSHNTFCTGETHANFLIYVAGENSAQFVGRCFLILVDILVRPSLQLQYCVILLLVLACRASRSTWCLRTRSMYKTTSCVHDFIDNNLFL